MLQLDADPFFDGVPIEYGVFVFAAVGIEPLQVPDAGGSEESMFALNAS